MRTISTICSSCLLQHSKQAEPPPHINNLAAERSCTGGAVNGAQDIEASAAQASRNAHHMTF